MLGHITLKSQLGPIHFSSMKTHMLAMWIDQYLHGISLASYGMTVNNVRFRTQITVHLGEIHSSRHYKTFKQIQKAWECSLEADALAWNSARGTCQPPPTRSHRGQHCLCIAVGFGWCVFIIQYFLNNSSPPFGNHVTHQATQNYFEYQNLTQWIVESLRSVVPTLTASEDLRRGRNFIQHLGTRLNMRNNH